MSDQHASSSPADRTARAAATADALAATVREVLTDQPWRELTPARVAAIAVAGLDRAAESAPEENAHPDVTLVHDERVHVLALTLHADPRWRYYTVAHLAWRLVAALRTWEERDFWFDLELRWLLDSAS